VLKRVQGGYDASPLIAPLQNHLHLFSKNQRRAIKAAVADLPEECAATWGSISDHLLHLEQQPLTEQQQTCIALLGALSSDSTSSAKTEAYHAVEALLRHAQSCPSSDAIDQSAFVEAFMPKEDLFSAKQQRTVKEAVVGLVANGHAPFAPLIGNVADLPPTQDLNGKPSDEMVQDLQQHSVELAEAYPDAWPKIVDLVQRSLVLPPLIVTQVLSSVISSASRKRKSQPENTVLDKATKKQREAAAKGDEVLQKFASSVHTSNTPAPPEEEAILFSELNSALQVAKQQEQGVFPVQSLIDLVLQHHVVQKLSEKHCNSLKKQLLKLDSVLWAPILTAIEERGRHQGGAMNDMRGTTGYPLMPMQNLPSMGMQHPSMQHLGMGAQQPMYPPGMDMQPQMHGMQGMQMQFAPGLFPFMG